MNKFVLGTIVLVLGGLLGWYYFRANPDVARNMGLTGPNTAGTNTSVTPSPVVTITDEPEADDTTKGGVATGRVVSYTDTGYSPKQLTVKMGETVIFKNDSSGGMWTASATHPTHQLLPGFDQKKSTDRGGTYTYTFTKIGTWQYHNHVKPTDTGVITVVQ